MRTRRRRRRRFKCRTALWPRVLDSGRVEFKIYGSGLGMQNVGFGDSGLGLRISHSLVEEKIQTVYDTTVPISGVPLTNLSWVPLDISRLRDS